MNMNEKDAYRYLEKTFVATFLDELMPGIFHNFANPLNGIMGRSKLMQRRLVEFIEKMRVHYPDMDADMGERCKKLLSDINAISDESEKFYDLFRISTGKFYAISAHNMDRLNLSSLIEAEMGFADFYLDFKHNVRKDIRIDHEMPDISGITAFCSMALWALIRQSTKNSRDANDQTFMITTDHDDQWVSVTINNIDGRLLQGWQGVLSDTTVGSVKFQDIPNNQKDLFYALLLLIKSSAGAEITHDGDAETLTVRIPHHLKKKEV
jgi:signal transduction histidine kinase